MDAKKDQVERFLQDFKIKKGIWGIFYRDDRGKNAQCLADLEMRPVDRDKVLDGIESKDYCKGPIKEELYNGADMWVFGKKFKGEEIYIKITLGANSDKVICISFHIAEQPIHYPLKTFEK